MTARKVKRKKSTSENAKGKRRTASVDPPPRLNEGSYKFIAGTPEECQTFYMGKSVLVTVAGVECRLAKGIDPAAWGKLCQRIGHLTPENFDKVDQVVGKD